MTKTVQNAYELLGQEQVNPGLPRREASVQPLAENVQAHPLRRTSIVFLAGTPGASRLGQMSPASVSVLKLAQLQTESDVCCATVTFVGGLVVCGHSMVNASASDSEMTATHE